MLLSPLRGFGGRFFLLFVSMLKLIQEIITKFGPRPAGTNAEKNAQQFIYNKAAELTDQREFLPFDEYLDARFGKLRYYVAFFFISLALYWVLPIAAVVLSTINLVVLVLDMLMYRDILTTFPGPKRTSHNVTATLEPRGEVKSTLLLSAHMDSTYEFTWWHKLGQTGVVLTVVPIILILVLTLLCVKHIFIPAQADNYVWYVLLILSPLSIFSWDMLGKDAVPGAQDNLSGIAIAYEVLKTFADPNHKGHSILKNTRLRFVSFGSEEKGLFGSRAYAALKKDELKRENAHLLNIDNVRVVNQISIIHREIMSFTSHSPVLVKGLQDSFAALNIPYKMAVAPIGGSDAISLARVGIPTVTVIAMDSEKHDFTYHTRHDVIENIEPRALENVKDCLVDFVKKWDAK